MRLGSIERRNSGAKICAMLTAPNCFQLIGFFEIEEVLGDANGADQEWGSCRELGQIMPNLSFSEVSEFAFDMHRDQGTDHGRGTRSCLIDSHSCSVVLIESVVIAANERIRPQGEKEMEDAS